MGSDRNMRSTSHSDKQLVTASKAVQRAVGTPAATRLNHIEGTAQVIIDAYLYVPPTEITFPPLPIHTIGVLLEGKSVQNLYPNSGLTAEPTSPAMTAPNHFVVVPKQRQTVWKAATGSVVMAAVFVSGTTQADLASLLQGRASAVTFHDTLVTNLIRQLLHVSASPLANSAYVSHLVNALRAQLHWLAAAEAEPRVLRSKTTDAAIASALIYIDQHLADALSSAHLAQLAGISTSLFRQRFRAATGVPLHQFILKRRVAQAAELTEQTDLSLSFIAHSCGFTSQSHMTAVFQKILGATPGTLRPHKKKGDA